MKQLVGMQGMPCPRMARISANGNRVRGLLICVIRVTRGLMVRAKQGIRQLAGNNLAVGRTVLSVASDDGQECPSYE